MKKIYAILSHSLFLSSLFFTFSILIFATCIKFLENRVELNNYAATASRISAAKIQKLDQNFTSSKEAQLALLENKKSSDSALPKSTASDVSKRTDSLSQDLPTPHVTQTVSPATADPTPSATKAPADPVQNQSASSAPSQAQQVLDALNAYRQKHGSGILTWNGTLGNFAQSRAELFASNGATDNHAGFQAVISSQDGFKQMGFWGLGENSSYGYPFNAVDLIEKEYASDKPHDDNQLDPSWTDVGIGIKGNASDIVFGKNKM